MKLLESNSLHEQTSTELLFVNIYPSTILNQKFPNFIKEVVNFYPFIRNNIVFEVIETEKIKNITLLKERINFLRNMDFLIAIDDVGKGWSSLSAIIELEPNYIKLDQYFSNNLAHSPLKIKMIKSL